MDERMNAHTTLTNQALRAAAGSATDELFHEPWIQKMPKWYSTPTPESIIVEIPHIHRNTLNSNTNQVEPMNV